MTPRFLKLDPLLFRRLPPLRKAAAALAAYREWRPEASLLEAADALGIPYSTARRWDAWLRDASATGGATDGATSGATSGATNGAFSIDSEIREGERGKNGPPAPLVSCIQDKTDEAAAIILAAAYMARCTRRKVTTPEAHGRILEDLRSGAYTPRDLAAYLDATPHTDAYPRELAAAVTTYLDHVNVRRTKAKELKAWSALRRRLADVRVGEAAWPTDEARAPPWTVAALDAEACRVDLKRCTSAESVYGGAVAAVYADRLRSHDEGILEERSLAGPDEMTAWTFESETMPLFAAAKKCEKRSDKVPSATEKGANHAEAKKQ